VLVAHRREDASLPTVLVYGHADVQPADPRQWREGLDPWVVVAEGDRWYGRGTADNKGQHGVNLAALAAVLAARGGRLGFNLTVLVETAEEIGSPGLRELCAERRDELAADVLVASDGPRVNAGTPTLFLGSRGIAMIALTVRRDGSHHSGNWGGALRNPATVLASALAAVVDGRGRLLVEALRPPPVPDAVRAALRDVVLGGDAGDPEVDVGWGEPGLTPTERVLAGNTFEVLALRAADVDRPVGAVPALATARCQLRFVVGTDVGDVAGALRRHLDERGFADVEVDVAEVRPATRLDPASPWVDWVQESVRRTTGAPATLLPNLGGTLPNDAFANVLGLPTLWLPHSHPGCRQHAPDEHLLAGVARQGLAVMAGVFWDLGEADGTEPALRPPVRR
jgi:acetylornithine deacetylase/succinyl-diaminopimelate desuccinylase-like protein